MPASQSARVAERIRADLLSGALRSGQKIPQAALATRYGVSRIPLREALTQLQAEGLVTHEPNRGYFVAELSAGDMREVYRLRELLEAEATSAACRNLSDADLERIADLAQRVAEALQVGDNTAIAHANRAFHFAVFGASGMPRLNRMLASLWDATDAYRGLYFQDPQNRRHVAAEHAALLAALRDRDAQAAVAAQAEHRDRSLAQVTAQLGGT
jgi:DNA-binding GntR family transcriptional regulator